MQSSVELAGSGGHGPDTGSARDYSRDLGPGLHAERRQLRLHVHVRRLIHVETLVYRVADLRVLQYEQKWGSGATLSHEKREAGFARHNQVNHVKATNRTCEMLATSSHCDCSETRTEPHPAVHCAQLKLIAPDSPFKVSIQ